MIRVPCSARSCRGTGNGISTSCLAMWRRSRPPESSLWRMRRERRDEHPMSLWKFLTSLRLTVTCLALAVLLIFFGTLAQVDEGLWKAQKIWFESYIVTWQHLQLFGLRFVVPIFPGGYLIGFTLLAGLIAAFIKR